MHWTRDRASVLFKHHYWPAPVMRVVSAFAHMSRQLSPEHQELYRCVDEVLHYLWDPLGVSDVPEARDEYHSYLPHVFSLIVQRASAQEIADFLDHTETHTMGLSDTERARERSKEIVSILERWRGVIHERYNRNT